MSTHVRRYGRYISEKVYTYRLCAFDFCKVKRGKDDGLLRTMPVDKLLKALPILQGQIDALLEFQVNSIKMFIFYSNTNRCHNWATSGSAIECLKLIMRIKLELCEEASGKSNDNISNESKSAQIPEAAKIIKFFKIIKFLFLQVNPSELTNGVINSCFILLFRDLIRLFACYNDGIINLLGNLQISECKVLLKNFLSYFQEKYFDMNKKQCREALDLYKKFLLRMDKVADFLKVAESVGIDRGEIPDLTRAPNSLLEALEAHLAALEGTKPGSRVQSPTSGYDLK